MKSLLKEIKSPPKLTKLSVNARKAFRKDTAIQSTKIHSVPRNHYLRIILSNIYPSKNKTLSSMGLCAFSLLVVQIESLGCLWD